MTLDDVTMTAVLGAGQMGRGIAQVLATAGWPVRLYDTDAAARSQAPGRIRTGLSRGVEKGLLSAGDVERITARVQPVSALADVAGAELVIEAVSEDAKLKQDVFGELGRRCQPTAVLASNTSSISITTLGTASGRPDRVVGIHFMNPVPAMRLVEVVRGRDTAGTVIELAVALATKLGKTPVISADAPGFIVNRILMPMINEAIYALEAGVATREDIDLAMVTGTNHPMGPLALADRIGLDTVLAICEVLHQDLGDSKFRPCPLLRQYVDAGRLGRKAGRGFYEYDQK